MSGRIVLHYHGANCEIVGRRVVTVTQSLVFDAIFIGKARVNFRARFWILIDQAPIRRVCVPDKY